MSRRINLRDMKKFAAELRLAKPSIAFVGAIHERERVVKKKHARTPGGQARVAKLRLRRVQFFSIF